MKNKISIDVSPIFDPWYYEFYFKGLVDHYGKENVNFNYSDRFIDFYKYSSTRFRKAFFYYEIKLNGIKKRVVISAEDWTDINTDVYDKVDCYAMVNVVKEQMEKYPKILPIGPNFGIRYFSTIDYLIFSLRLFNKRGIKNPFLKTYFSNSLKRSFFTVYEKSSKKLHLNRTFYLNYPWSKHKEVTNRRKEIIEILKDLETRGLIIFEGGFSKKRFGYHKNLKEYSAKRVYGHKAYIDAVKRAGFVVNTPAVHGCLGWKLGEYLALGKTIVSLPFGRVMPGNFQEDVHYLKINDIQELENKIEELLTNRSKMTALSENAENYFREFLKPKKVIYRIHDLLIK